MDKPMLTDLDRASAGDLAQALVNREVSAVELVDAAIAGIEARDRAINAVVVRDFDRAVAAAKMADAALARGERGALLGVPMTVKESHAIAGLPITWGSEGFRGFVSESDSVGVARLKSGGAVILGKTNVPPFLGDWQSANPIYGRTNNPWDLDRTPGGSSGGSAAALASGMVPLEFGSDIGGSIRVPAAFCGVYGHKPTFGVIPMRGHSPPDHDGGGGGPLPLAVVGPLARTAADLDLALDVLAGPDEPDAKAYRLTLPPARKSRLSDFRILILDRHPAADTEAEVTEAIGELGTKLARLGAVVRDTDALTPDLAKSHDVFLAILSTALSRGAPGASPPNAHEWMGLLDAQVQMRRSWGRLFGEYDVVLAPNYGITAFPHDANPDQGARKQIINGRTTPYMSQVAWPGLALVSNLPATAAPIGLSKNGLPLSVQIIGGYLEDRTTIGFAGLLEQEFGGFQPPPGY